MKHEFEIVTRYPETGLPKSYRMNGLVFDWTDWVLCKIAFSPNNPPHWCIASSFRVRYGRDGKPEDLSADLWNPSWEGEVHEMLSDLHIFQPCKIILEARKDPE